MFDYLTIQFIQLLKVNPDQLDLIGWQVCRSFLVSNWLKISCISLTMQPIQFNSVAPPNIPKIDLIRWQVCRSFLPSNWPKISCICLTIPTPWHRLSCSVVRQSHRCTNPISVARTRSEKVTGSEVQRSDSMDPGLSHSLKRSNGSIGYIRKS